MRSYKPLGSCRPVPYSTVCSRIGLYSRSSLILSRQPLGEPKLLWMGICILLILQTQNGKKYKYIHSYSTLSYLLTSLSPPPPFFSPSTLSLYLHFILLSFFFPLCPFFISLSPSFSFLLSLPLSFSSSNHMFLWNNIFFSTGFDGRGHFKDFGGDEAGHAAAVSQLIRGRG